MKKVNQKDGGDDRRPEKGKRPERLTQRSWQNGFQQQRSPEPVFASMMHIINRLASGAEAESEIEKECARIFRHATTEAKNALSGLARDYMALPKAFRAKSAPPVLVRLDPATPLSDELYRLAVEESFLLGSRPITPAIVEATLNQEGELLLLGSGFTAGQGALTIWVEEAGQAGERAGNPARSSTGIRPISVTAGTIRFALPAQLREKKDVIVRLVWENKLSHQVQDAIHRIYTDLIPHITPDPNPPVPAPPPPLPPKILRIVPDGSRAGEVILIDGENFKPYIDLNGCRVHVEDLDRETGFAAHVLVNGKGDADGWRADFVSPTQIKLRLGDNIPPGRYGIRVSDDTTKLFSDIAPYKIEPWRYRVNFLNFSCTDESNEASGSDEIVTAWAISADEKYFLKSTYEYEGVDQGGNYDYRNEDRSVLTPSGDSYPVKFVLSIVTRLYEWDSEGQTRLNSEDASYKIAQALSSSGNSTAQAASVVVVLVGLLADALSSIDSGADPLGEQTLVWTSAELLKATRNPQRRFEGELFFNNPDSEGSHIVRYEVLREF